MLISTTYRRKAFVTGAKAELMAWSDKHIHFRIIGFSTQHNTPTNPFPHTRRHARTHARTHTIATRAHRAFKILRMFSSLLNIRTTRKIRSSLKTFSPEPLPPLST